MAAMRIIGLAALLLAAAPSPADPGRARLLIEQRSFVPGADITACLWIQLERGWHTYWQNPGDNGMAPRIDWELPHGFTPGSPCWPVPDVFGEEPSISYGHAEELLLLIPIHTSTDIPAGSTPTLKARVRWLACREACVPGSAGIGAPVTAANIETLDGASTGLFARARSKLPTRAPPLPPALWRGDEIIVRVPMDCGAGDARRMKFFCDQPELIDPSAPQSLTRAGQHWELRLRLAPYAKREPIGLTGILVLDLPPLAAWRVDLKVEKQEQRR